MKSKLSRGVSGIGDQHSQMYCPSVIDLENPEELAKAEAEKRRKARNAA